MLIDQKACMKAPLMPLKVSLIIYNLNKCLKVVANHCIHGRIDLVTHSHVLLFRFSWGQYVQISTSN